MCSYLLSCLPVTFIKPHDTSERSEWFGPQPGRLRNNGLNHETLGGKRYLRSDNGLILCFLLYVLVLLLWHLPPMQADSRQNKPPKQLLRAYCGRESVWDCKSQSRWVECWGNWRHLTPSSFLGRGPPFAFLHQKLPKDIALTCGIEIIWMVCMAEPR